MPKIAFCFKQVFHTIKVKKAKSLARKIDTRTVAVQALYAYDMGNEDVLSFIDELFEQKKVRNKKKDFGKELLFGTLNHLQEIDKIIEQKLPKKWDMTRLGKIDKALLRLGAFEIMFYDTDKPLAINEMIEIAKKLGDDDTPKFINGILNELNNVQD